MSADYWLEIDAGGPERIAITESFNVTYNLGPMLRAAGFPDWKDLTGAPASEAAGMLTEVAAKLEADRERLEAEFTPEEWGSWDWAHKFVTGLRDACAAAPRAVIASWL